MTFLLGALLLCLIAIASLLAPLWLRRRGGDRRRAVAALIATRLAELERERNAGLLDETTYRQLRLEQERRLLEEAAEAASISIATSRRWLLPACALLLPLAALLVYRQLGGWADWQIQGLVERSQSLAEAGEDNRALLDELVAKLERRLQETDDEEGRRRFLLARLTLQMGHFETAARHYHLLAQQFPQDAALGAQYAQALYLSSGRKLTPEVLEQANKSLAIDADQTTALGLLGIAAFEAGDYAGALTHWRRLLAQLPPDSGNARAIEQGIRQAEAALGEAGEAPAATAGPQLQVAISLAPALQAQLPEGGTLFVFARAVGGPPLPLAVVKHSAPQLPLQVELDDSLAMAPGSNLSGALASGGAVEVVARITASGQVFGAPGDLEGSSGPLTLTGDPQPLSVTIDRRL